MRHTGAQSLQFPVDTMSDIPALYPVPDDFAAAAAIKRADYERLYAESVQDPDAFWAEGRRAPDWDRKPTQVRDVSYDLEDFRIRWYADGELNASVNCLDRHLATRGDKTALIWEVRRPGRAVAARELSRTAPARVQARQCAAQPRREARAIASPSTCR